MQTPFEKYRAALAAFATPGSRWANKGALTYWGKAAGLTAEEIIADARAAGVRDRDADIRRGWNDARPRADAGRWTARANVRRATQTRAESAPLHVRNLIGDLDYAMHGTIDWVREMSPCLDWLGKPPATQTELFIRAAFAPSELLYVFRADPPTPGKMGDTIRRADEWATRPTDVARVGECIVPNPLTGKTATTGKGKQSLIANGCIAAYNYLVIEFDDIRHAFNGDTARGLAVQYAFWRNFILREPMASNLVSLTYSGGKSLHGLLYVGCDTLEEWQGVRNRIVALYASDPTTETTPDGRTRYPFRADDQTMHQRHGTRLPGVIRSDKGTLQELVYLNPCARFAPAVA